MESSSDRQAAAFSHDFARYADEQGWLIGGSHPKSREQIEELANTYCAGYMAALSGDRRYLPRDAGVMGPKRIHVETSKRSYDSLGPDTKVVWDDDEDVISMEWTGDELEVGGGS